MDSEPYPVVTHSFTRLPCTASWSILTWKSFWILLHNAPWFMRFARRVRLDESITLIRSPFLPALRDVHGFELAALDTLQHGLARDAELARRFGMGRSPAGGLA